MKRFALIGAAGYVAPRHMQAIKDIGGELVAVLDPHDSVGILDSYFPECLYFREPERFDRWLSQNPLDYVSVCSPNYLHDAHCLMSMRNGADVICEKPLTCHERNLDNLAEWEVKTGKKVNVVLQCRLHPEVEHYADDFINCKIFPENPFGYNVKIDYRTPRGAWYNQSWKGDAEKSGGIATNIGIHLFDLCLYLFGEPLNSVHKTASDCASGKISTVRANIEWRLSIKQGEPKRIFSIDKFTIDLTKGLEDLHTKTYEHILSGNGFGIESIRPATRIVEAIRNDNL